VHRNISEKYLSLRNEDRTRERAATVDNGHLLAVRDAAYHALDAGEVHDFGCAESARSSGGVVDVELRVSAGDVEGVDHGEDNSNGPAGLGDRRGGKGDAEDALELSVARLRYK
jgi:hypothetical protein